MQRAQIEKDDIQRAKKQKKMPTSHKFVEKYERLVGKETGKDSARVLEANDQFGLGKIYYILLYIIMNHSKLLLKTFVELIKNIII